MYKPFIAVCFLVLSVMGFGCVRVEAKSKTPEPSRLVVTRDTNGVNMQFMSQEGLHYTVYYRNPKVPNNQWHALPQATKITGTGELIKIKDLSADAFYRKYRVHTIVPGAPFSSLQN